MRVPPLGGRRFSEVRSRGSSGRNGDIRAWTMPNRLETVRLGMSVPRARTAVVRNRVRRRLRAAITEFLPALSGTDVILSATPASAEAVFVALRNDVHVAVNKATAKASSRG